MPNATVANITLCFHDSETLLLISSNCFILSAVASEIEQKACFEEFGEPQ